MGQPLETSKIQVKEFNIPRADSNPPGGLFISPGNRVAGGGKGRQGVAGGSGGFKLDIGCLQARFYLVFDVFTWFLMFLPGF
ncbi:MAG: hypothetical protein IKX54_00690 [Lachnospiraceae bacterium]|nr:hypothetical protein [Lachnospiraceae bacterium]